MRNWQKGGLYMAAAIEEVVGVAAASQSIQELSGYSSPVQEGKVFVEGVKDGCRAVIYTLICPAL